MWFSLAIPNLWDTIPMPVVAFLSENDFSGKTVCTVLHQRGKPSGGDVTDITKLCPQSTILDGLAVRGGDAKKIAQNEVHLRLHERELI